MGALVVQTYLQLYIISNKIWPCQASPSFKSISVQCLGPKVILRFNYHKLRRAFGFAYIMSRFLRNFCPTNQFLDPPQPGPWTATIQDHHCRARLSSQLTGLSFLARWQFAWENSPLVLGIWGWPAYDSQAFPCKKFPPKKSQVEIRRFMTVHHLLIRDLRMRHTWYTMM